MTQDSLQADDRRYRLQGLISKYFNNDNDAVVRAIEGATGHAVSVRSVQSWLISPTRSSHRAVPEWALRALEEFVNKPEHQPELQNHAERAKSNFSPAKGSFAWADEVRSSKAVDLATGESEHKQRQIARWRELLGTATGNAIAESFLAQEREIAVISNALGAITRALHECPNFDDFRRQADEAMQDSNLTRFHVREARTALEHGTDEFSNPEGLPTPSSRESL